MAKSRIWRTAPSGTEGMNTVYVDGSFGDNEKNGTRDYPYQTLDEAYYATFSTHNIYPTKIVCVGPIRGDVVFNHETSVIPDYEGAAWYDGEGKNIPMYAAAYDKMWLTNCFREWDPLFSQLYPTGYERDKRGFLAGVGRAGNAAYVYLAYGAFGVASGSVKLWKCQAFRGMIGANGKSKMIFAKMMRSSPTCKCVIGTYGTIYDSESTFYDCQFTTGHRDRRETKKYVQLQAKFKKCLFSKFDIFVDDYTSDSFVNCYFGSDCKFIFKYDDKNYFIMLEEDGSGTTHHHFEDAPCEGGEESLYRCHVNGVKDIPEAIQYLRNAGIITVSTVPEFKDCVFNGDVAEDLFIDAEHMNFALHRHCGAVDQNNYSYYGAVGPALELEIHEHSDGMLNCWDARTKEGCVDITDGAISADDTAREGAIFSKIIKVNHHFEQINGFNIPHMWKHNIGIAMTRDKVWGARYSAGDILPTGVYKVFGVGSVSYTEEEAGATLTYKHGETIYVSEANTTFFNNEASDCYLTEVLDLNPYDCIYVRCRQAIYGYANEGDILVPGVWYMNENEFPIKYRGRSIIPGESFCAEDALSFSSESGGSQLSIVFDDVNGYDGAIPDEPWITPAMLEGRYFVSKSGTGLDKDGETGIWAQSCGNYRVWKNGSGDTYEISGTANIINQPYVQFAIFVKRA